MAIKLVESYSVQLARNSVRDSLQSHGEECIALSMYHVNADEKIQPRCPICFDDTYKQPDPQCNYCYGTTFKGGIKYATRMWAMFADTSKVEAIRERGVWVPDAREMQCEAFPLFMERDYVVRVRKWTSDHRPLEIEGYYAIGQVSSETQSVPGTGSVSGHGMLSASVRMSLSYRRIQLSASSPWSTWSSPTPEN